MGFSTASSGSQPVSKTPTIYNVTTTLANTEYSQLLSNNTKKLQFRVRNAQGARLQYAFVSGDSSLNYVTLPRGAVYSEENLNLTNVTLYFQSSVAGVVVEILEWV